MKRTVEALVVRMLVAVLAIAGLSGAAGAEVLPVVTLKGTASLAGPAGAGVFHVTASFATDTPGAPPLTLQQAVIFFPDRAGTNGHLFPSCGARQIEGFRGDVRRCPKGSKIGSGTVKARALELGVTAYGRVNVFNSGRGKNITFNIQTTNPAYINESLDAPLARQQGVYGEKLTLVVPHTLQEIIGGVFVGVQEFDVTLTGSATVRGRPHSFFRARRCPTRAMRGVFDFKDWTTGRTATVTADATIDCTAG